MRKKTLAYTLTFIAAGIIIGFFIAGSLKHETLTLAEKDSTSRQLDGSLEQTQRQPLRGCLRGNAVHCQHLLHPDRRNARLRPQ